MGEITLDEGPVKGRMVITTQLSERNLQGFQNLEGLEKFVLKNIQGFGNLEGLARKCILSIVAGWVA